MALQLRLSGIHRSGCFTTAPIRKGARIIEYTGPRLSVEQGDALYQERDHTFLFGLSDGKTVIDGHGMAAFINHSCDPNCETEEDERMRVWIIARRDIQVGEELSYDYLLYAGEGEAPCSCGTAGCRGSMYAPRGLKRRRNRRRPRRTLPPRAA